MLSVDIPDKCIITPRLCLTADSAMILPQFITLVMNSPCVPHCTGLTVVMTEYKTLPINCPCALARASPDLSSVCVYKVIMM